MMRTCNRATALALAALAWATACSGPPGNPEPAPISAAAPEVPEAAATTEIYTRSIVGSVRCV